MPFLKNRYHCMYMMTMTTALMAARMSSSGRAVFVGALQQQQSGLVGRGRARSSSWSHQQHRHRSTIITTTTPTFGVVRRPVQLWATTEQASLSTSTTTTVEPIKGIEWVRSVVLDVLNDAFDPAEVARNAALARLEKKPKKKKKKKKPQQEEATAADPDDAAPPLTDAEKQAVGDAAAAAAPKSFGASDTMVTPATKLEFGDYQCNAAMGLSAGTGLSSRDCAVAIVAGLARYLPPDVLREPEIAGPGFINLRFTDAYLSDSVLRMAHDAEGRLAVPRARHRQKIVVDFSSPNIAKEMHVGHLRSTVLGDTLSNVLDFQGHEVKRLNHVGDWGTQFGMLVEHLRDEYPAALDPQQEVDLGDLVTLYKAAKQRFDADDAFKMRAREGVVRLQAGDQESLAAWESLCAASRGEYQKIYDTLDIKGLEERGESFYNPYLNGVVEDLESQGLAVPSEGATAVFLDGYKNRDGTPLPMLVRKSDGGFNYATTDMAAIRHRVQLEDGEQADRVLYVTDSGQSQHFEMVFAAAKLAGLVAPEKSLEHVPFGLVQGEDGKKFATRSGDTVKLKDLLDEAVRIAGEDVMSRWEEDDDAEMSDEVQRVIRTVGIGAVKYADLSLNRESNYRFSYERMLSLNGNTAPYMLYAYARICGIVRKATSAGGESGDSTTGTVWPEPAGEILVTHDAELQLIRNLVRLPDVLSEVENDLYPNRMCDYLFETSQKFNQFYENCSVNKAETPELKASRLTLCTVTAATIRLLMGMLGIDVVEKL